MKSTRVLLLLSLVACLLAQVEKISADSLLDLMSKYCTEVKTYPSCKYHSGQNIIKIVSGYPDSNKNVFIKKLPLKKVSPLAPLTKERNFAGNFSIRRVTNVDCITRVVFEKFIWV